MITHIATPTIVTTEAFNASIPTHFTVDRIPGLWSNLSFSLQPTNDIVDVLEATPCVLGYSGFGVNNILGWNQIILFGTLKSPEYEGGTFHDPFATQYNVSCNVIPQSEENPYTGNLWLMDNDTSHYSLSMNLTTCVNLYPGSSMVYTWGPPGLDFLLEQPTSQKENESSTPVFPVPDILASLEPSQSQSSHTGVFPMVFISGSPHALVEGGVISIPGQRLPIPPIPPVYLCSFFTNLGAPIFHDPLGTPRWSPPPPFNLLPMPP
ncbi:uncharacterized protein EI90DRAFT_3119565 [Cantharellus anzutake]|uniref:uncharacterized protein n=1 Tax=Cantharellus anzutake TaxID=1750568 RepID=UPI00190732E2|nr:uncharacterized protein EI90DRAFT_3119565 [Cantharellus anzutake]KAF8336297.1 hypothetical protein EI90DRAFT_3119565 [Cantharellus anzutake]